MRFALYRGARESLHWLRWLPYRCWRAVRQVLHLLRSLVWHVWHFLYWLPHRIRALVGIAWHFLYWLPHRLRHGAAAIPKPPAWGVVSQAVASLRRLKIRLQARRVGTFKPVRHADAAEWAARDTQLLPATQVCFDAPRLFGPLPPGWPLPWPPVQAGMQPISALKWKNARVIGRSDAVLVGRRCIVGDLWQRATERTWDEVWGYARPRREQISYYCRRTPELRLERGIVLVGGPTPNWAHWTTEYLPKIALVDALAPYQDWPIVVDEALHPNMVASLELVARKRELVRVPQGTLVRLQHALSIGSPGYTAYEYRYDWNEGPPGFRREHTMFSPAALDLVRQRAWASAQAEPARERRIFITRPKGSMRTFVGVEAVERMFAEAGFELIDTGGMSAADQVRLFARARCIVGQSGAGMTNLVFAPPGCRVVVFAANSAHSIFHYFANMGAAAGHHVYYCYGEAILEPGSHPGHAGFSVQPEDATQVWRAVLDDEPDLHR